MSGINHMMLTDYNVSTTPAYTITFVTSNPMEGQPFYWILTASNIPAETVLYWTLSYGTASNADFPFVQGGNFVISPGTTSINSSFDITADNLTEGTETFYLNFRTGSVTGPIVASGGPYSIADTSITTPDAISGNLGITNQAVYAQAAQYDLIPISSTEYAMLATIPGIQAQSGMKDTAYSSYNTISTIGSPGPLRQTSASSTYWLSVQSGGYVHAVKVKTGEGPYVNVLMGFQIGYGTTTTGAGVALSNKLTRSATTDANGFLYFAVKQPNIVVPAGAYMTILVSGFPLSYVGSSIIPINNSGTQFYYTSATSSTPITQTLNNSSGYAVYCVSWLSTTIRPW